MLAQKLGPFHAKSAQATAWVDQDQKAVNMKLPDTQMKHRGTFVVGQKKSNLTYLVLALVHLAVSLGSSKLHFLLDLKFVLQNRLCFQELFHLESLFI